MAGIPPISVSPAALQSLQLPSESKPTENSNLFAQLLQQTNQDQMQSDQMIQDLAEGKIDNVQQVVLAVAKAEMSFQFFMEIRNKLIDSYNELARMQF